MGWLELLWNFWVVFDVSPGSGNRCTLWLMVAESGFLPQPVVRWMVLPSPVDQPASFSSAAAESRPPVCTEVAPQRERRPPKKTLFWGKTCTGWVELGWEHCDFRGLLASACCLIWERVGYGECGGKVFFGGNYGIESRCVQWIEKLWGLSWDTVDPLKRFANKPLLESHINKWILR